MSTLIVTLYLRPGSHTDFRRLQKRIAQQLNIKPGDISYVRYFPVRGRSRTKAVELHFYTDELDEEDLKELFQLLTKVKSRSEIEDFIILKAKVIATSQWLIMDTN